MVLEANSRLEDYQLKEKEIAIRFSITGSATAASVVHSTDIPGIFYVGTEGNLADSIDSGITVTENDSGGVFALLLTEAGSIKKIIHAEVKDMGAETGGSDTASAVAVVLAGASNSGITASGNVALEVTGTGLNLTSENFSGVMLLRYLMAE